MTSKLFKMTFGTEQDTTRNRQLRVCIICELQHNEFQTFAQHLAPKLRHVSSDSSKTKGIKEIVIEVVLVTPV